MTNKITKFFEVVDFANLQHYKDRNPPWIKLYNELLDSYNFACLQDASKLHLILIFLLASRTNNKIPYDATWIKHRINATENIDLQALEESGMIRVLGNASKALASCKQSAITETEREREGEGEGYSKKEANKLAPKKGALKNFQKEEEEITVQGIMCQLNDKAIATARQLAPGWDLHHLAGVYADNINDGKKDKPRFLQAAFPKWCEIYTKGKRP
jgi:hypothetical protein